MPTVDGRWTMLEFLYKVISDSDTLSFRYYRSRILPTSYSLWVLYTVRLVSILSPLTIPGRTGSDIFSSRRETVPDYLLRTLFVMRKGPSVSC